MERSLDFNMINKLNYRDAKDLICDIYALESKLIDIKSDSSAKKSNLLITGDATDGKNGWPIKYMIPSQYNYKIYECLEEIYKDILDKKYKKLNNL